MSDNCGKNENNSNKSLEDWMNKKWRPLMGYTYMAVCIFDFILAPILWAIIQFWETSVANDAFRQWQPLTLQGAGLFHMAMGAVLGLSAWGRTQEKLNGANNGGAAPSPMSSVLSSLPASTPTVTPPMQVSVPTTPTPVASAAVAAVEVNDKGKKVVPAAPEPQI